ncbi:MAG: hypothetical protein KAY61_02340 [Candidatus Eisenbacteria bacterium]|nr:hypothetical protein [Candidatus Eisenbacteria bacterium]
MPSFRRLAFLIATTMLVALPGAAHAVDYLWQPYSIAVSPHLVTRQDALVSDGAGGWFHAVVNDQGTLFVHHLLPSGRAAAGWPATGVSIGATSGIYANIALSSDGQGGVLVTFERTTNFNDVYVQRVTAAGAIAAGWPSGGRAVSVSSDYEYYSSVTHDGAGGALVAFIRSSEETIYLQHVHSFGKIDEDWPADGCRVHRNGRVNTRPTLQPDGLGGANLVYRTSDGVLTLFAQHVTAGGLIEAPFPEDGIPLSTGPVATWAQGSDLYSHSVVVWTENRSGTQFDAYANSFDWNGLLGANPVEGRKITTTTYDEESPKIAVAPDGTCGLLWLSVEAGTQRARMLRLLADQSPDPAWSSSGVVVGETPASAAFFQPSIALSSDGGYLALFSNTDLFLSRLRLAKLDGSGKHPPGWGALGNIVDSGATNLLLYSPFVCSDADGGALCQWVSAYTYNNYGYTYGQRVRFNGAVGRVAAARISAAQDVPNDQGGKLSLYWRASEVDSTPSNPIGSYMVWRRMPALAAAAALRSGARESAVFTRDANLQPGALRTIANATTTEYWEYLGSTPARGWPGYGMTVHTLSDLAGPMYPTPWESYLVEAITPMGAVYATSEVDSGYSVDNLSPGMPVVFSAARVGGATHLHWSRSLEADFGGYELHRGASASFEPGPATLIHASADTGWVDVTTTPAFYKLAAVDVHGNASAYALVTPAATLDAPSSGALALVFAPVRPNPARGAAQFAFTLPAAGAARLALFDAQGRHVRTLVEGVQPAGARQAAWDLRDGAGHRVAPGLYLARLESGGVTRMQRIAIVE